MTLGKILVATTSRRLAGWINSNIGKMREVSLQHCDIEGQNAPPRSVGLQIKIPAPLTTARRLSSDHATAPPETGAAYNPQTSTVGHIRCHFLYPHCIKPVHNSACLVAWGSFRCPMYGKVLYYMLEWPFLLDSIKTGHLDLVQWPGMFIIKAEHIPFSQPLHTRLHCVVRILYTTRCKSHLSARKCKEYYMHEERPSAASNLRSPVATIKGQQSSPSKCTNCLLLRCSSFSVWLGWR